MDITIAEDFHKICPNFIGGAITATITNTPTSPELWFEIEELCSQINQNYTIDTIKERAGISATRQAYKAAGKDPSRYRPACEQLARRVLQGKGLYSIDTIVDIGNYVSLHSGYATAMLDVKKIHGTTLTLRLGTESDVYEGIGRGVLNISSLPTYSDQKGAIATPTSDSNRTKVSLETSQLLMLVNAYDGNISQLHIAIEIAENLLKRYAQAIDIKHWTYK